MDRCGEHVRARSQTLAYRAWHRDRRFARILSVARKKQGSNRNMSGSERTKRSVYMQWAKTHSHARFNLATSGLISVPLSEFPVRLEDLEITAPGAYGYEPLRQRLARHNNVPEECVVAATGTSMANHLAMAAVLNPGGEVLVE